MISNVVILFCLSSYEYVNMIVYMDEWGEGSRCYIFHPIMKKKINYILREQNEVINMENIFLLYNN